MNIQGIKDKARKENHDAKDYALTLYWQLTTKMKSKDFNVSARHLSIFESICDCMEIPCFHVGDETFALAKTYSDLLSHEERR